MAALTQALFILRIVSPALVLLSGLSVIPARAPPTPPAQITSVVVKTQTPRRALILSFLSLASLSFLADGLAFVVYAVINKYWPKYSAIEISAILGIIAYSGLAALGAYKDIKGVDVWSFRSIKTAVTLALALDIATVVLQGISFTEVTIPVVLHLAFPAFRVLLLIPLTIALYNPRIVYTPVHESADEIHTPVPTRDTTFLLAPEPIHASTGLNPVSGKYGTFGSSRSQIPASGPTTRATTPVGPSEQVSPSSSKKAKKEISHEPSWGEIGTRLKHLTPYLWPSGSRPLQLIGLVCMVLLALGRVVNVFLPLTLGKLVKTFEDHNDGVSFWPYLITYIVLRFLQSTGGIAALRDSLWGPVMQYSDRAMSQLAFDHLLNLSLSFHIKRKTGEVLRILDRGAAINHILELILFNIIPTFLDIIIALVVFAFLFDWTLTIVIFFVMVAYVYASIVLTRWRTKIRREMNERDITTRGIHTDCLLNYETVKYFSGEQHEGERYRTAIKEYQALEYKVIVSLNLLNLVQNFITTLGFLVGTIIMALRVTDGRSDASEFVIFIVYLAQLYGPLSMLGTIYRSLNTSLVDTEKLLNLLNEPTDVNDKPNAPDLIVKDGEIEFDNVSFSYDDRTPALTGISFKVGKGSSVALVGESGSGKSTILRLLYRFYDLKEGQGRILIDGQDIRDVTQSSLRKAIGVVPQDSVLFNSTIGYNIGYGKLNSTTEEIENAAKAASLHDRIMSFPKGYETTVGERGVRLSGGEKQRVAIARTLLKNPPVLLLDEATSALDTSTEKDIQKAFETLQEGRSSLSIAHRLSTIATADLILVLRDGQIVEAGTHSELLAQDGAFAVMWNDQISASDQGSVKRRSVVGYEVPENDTNGDVHPEIPAEDAPTTDMAVADEAQDDLPAEPTVSDDAVVTADAPIAFPSSNGGADSTAPSTKTGPAPPPKDESAPISFPAAISFPGGGDEESQRTPSVADAGSRAQSTPAGVTFESQEPPSGSRTDTPDPDAEPKRKRISSQNFQRLARRVSISTKRTASSTGLSIANLSIPGIPGFKREGSSKSKDEAPQPDAPVLTDSPRPSIQSDSLNKDGVSRGTTLKKKDKKDKRKTLG